MSLCCIQPGGHDGIRTLVYHLWMDCPFYANDFDVIHPNDYANDCAACLGDKDAVIGTQSSVAG